ncbi:MAG: alpha/beta hydrolase, partial [Chitinophagales bacterium]|nr:alpha/beta hydrolase [Chitinophagales bacterium]
IKLLTAWLDSLCIDSCYVIGSSLGGYISACLSVAAPDKVKRLVLISSAGYESQKILYNLKYAKKPFLFILKKKGLPLTVSKLAAKRLYFNPIYINDAEVQYNNWFWNMEGNLEAVLHMLSSGELPDSGMIKKIACPTIILWGKDDKVLPYTHLYMFQRDLKGAQTALIESCGHLPMLEKPDITYKYIHKFFGANTENIRY